VKPPYEALSAIVSTNLMRQSAMRLATISTPSAQASVAATTSSVVVFAEDNSSRIRNATSPSIRG
jgi:hypothetical protein